MIFTRLGYAVIVTIIAGAAAAVLVVLWPTLSDLSLTDDDEPTRQRDATAELQLLGFEQVVNFIRYGAVTELEEDGDDVIVRFREDFDTAGLGTDAHTFRTVPPAGEDVEAALQAAGIAVNGDSGVRLVRQ
jgi:hypothetical protein